MPRYRKLHTKTVESLDLNDMPDDFHRLFWVLLPLALCREGRGLDNPAWLKSNLFPLRTDIGQEDITTAFAWFTEREMIITYTAKGRGYFYVPTFHKYQGNTRKEAESNYPPPPDSAPTDSTDNPGPSPELVGTSSGVGQTDVAANPSASASASEYCILPIASASVVELNALEAFTQARGGAINPLDVDALNDLVSEFENHRAGLPRGSPGADASGEEWVYQAILTGNASRKPGTMVNVPFVRSILGRWKISGYMARFGQAAETRTENGRTVIRVDT